jgi:hypothetical protein
MRHFTLQKYRAMCNQQERATGLIFVEVTTTSQRHMQQLQNEDIPVTQGAGHVDRTFFQ